MMMGFWHYKLFDSIFNIVRFCFSKSIDFQNSLPLLQLSNYICVDSKTIYFSNIMVFLSVLKYLVNQQVYISTIITPPIKKKT